MNLIQRMPEFLQERNLMRKEFQKCNGSNYMLDNGKKILAIYNGICYSRKDVKIDEICTVLFKSKSLMLSE